MTPVVDIPFPPRVSLVESSLEFLLGNERALPTPRTRYADVSAGSSPPCSRVQRVGYFSFMVRRCSLSKWTTNSATVVAEADTVDGPYTLLGNADPATLRPGSPAMPVQPWSHNTFLSRDPPSGEWLLWHIGAGQTPPSQWVNCSDDLPDGTPWWEHARRRRGGGDTEAVPPAGGAAAAEDDPVAPVPIPGDTFYVATAPTLRGPWNTSNLSFVDVNQPPAAGPNYWAVHKSNPSPFIFDNGSALVFFSSQNCPPGWPGAKAPACVGMATAPTWQGPYTAVGTTPITTPESEDPSVFRDPRGNFHLLTNVNTYHKHCPAGVACGGHAHSADGIHWSALFVGAFGPVITFENGTVYNAAYVERPQVVQDADGTPVGFFVGTGIGGPPPCGPARPTAVSAVSARGAP